jgi:hypothetical protein
MKKKAMVLVGVVIVAMTSLGNIALSLVEDPQWTPYVQSWNRKLPTEKTNIKAKKRDSITMCGTPEIKTSALQR